jgi:pimeloyl-ACP methyl ester carboxylesterase
MRSIAAAGFALAAGLAVTFGSGRDAQAEDKWMQLGDVAAMPAPAESGYADVNGIEMYYATFGAGEPLILLHGGLGNADYWGNQVPELAKQFKVIVADSRGHGRSTRSVEPYSYDLMASDVVALMDHLKIDKASLVGWSDGGIIGLDIAIKHPERLDKLFAFGANYDPSGLREDIGGSVVFNAYIEKCGQDYAKLSKTPTEYEAFLNAIGEMWATQPNYTPEQLKSITVPTVIADGAYDEGIKQEHTKEMAGLIPGAKLLVMPELSHFAMWQDPAAFNTAVLDFLTAE